MGPSHLRRLVLPLAILVVLGAISLVYLGGKAAGLQASDAPGAGLKVQVTAVDIPADRKPVVTFKITDDRGQPLALADTDQGSVRFTIARLDTDEPTGLTHWTNYVTGTVKGQPFQYQGTTQQPALPEALQALSAMDSTGAFADKGGGTFIYTFITVLPENYPKDLTYALGMQATRESRRWASNDVFYFVPGGGAPKSNRQIVTNGACNRCHDPVSGHGGQRVDVNLCTLCHTPQTTDPESGNSVEFGPMVHKLHNGASLPSVKGGKPFFIVGFQQSVVDFTKAVWPQDSRNCQTCHNGPQGDNWRTAPNQAACGSCHDNVNAITGQNHPTAGPQTNASCKGCHTGTMSNEFDLSIPGAHFQPTFSKQLRGVQFTMNSVSNTAPGQNPKVQFQIKDRDGNPIAPSEMSRIALTLAGPTTDYSQFWNEDASKAADAGGGTYEYTFQQAIPANATGTFAVGIEGYIQKDITGFGGKPITNVRDAGFNRVLYSAVTGAIAYPRKAIVRQENCNQCHQHLGDPAGFSIHGGFRRNVEYCVLCHNPNTTDEGQRPPDQMPPATVHFKPMIHRIHTGEEGQRPFVVYGFGKTRIDLGEAVYPGDRRNCQKCHIPGSQYINWIQAGALPTTVRQAGQVISSMQPITSACTACHDNPPALGHAALNTAPQNVETCAVCHKEVREFAVSKVHSR